LGGRGVDMTQKKTDLKRQENGNKKVCKRGGGGTKRERFSPEQNATLEAVDWKTKGRYE